MLPRFGKGSLALLLLTLAATAILSDQPLGTALRLQPGSLLRGEGVWQPLTANFVYPGDGVGLVIGTLFVQWFFGSPLEAFWGTRRYLVLMIGAGTAGYLVYALLAPVLPPVEHGGSNAMDLAALTAFAVVFGKQELSLLGAVNMRGRTLAGILVVLGVVGPLGRGAQWPVVVPWLVSIAIALLVTLQPWRGRGEGGGGRKRAKAKPSHLRVVPKDELLN
ncbi:MAG: rhomboid family intramembrane serine protease [Nannocystaceae bacterium]|nr:rhomboid family intramembrane serine protease [Nannocystaceae bacterium]